MNAHASTSQRRRLATTAHDAAGTATGLLEGPFGLAVEGLENTNRAGLLRREP